MTIHSFRVVLALALPLMGCVGEASLFGRAPGGTASPGSGNPFAPGEDLATGSSQLQWRRLTVEQLDNTMRDLLKDSSRLARQKLSGEILGSSGFATAGVMTALDVERLDSAVDAWATNATASLVSGKLVPCDPTTSSESACAQTFVQEIGAQIFRRPLMAEEAADFKALYTEGRGTLALSFQGALALVLKAMLQSPAFLYLGEDLQPGATQDGQTALGPYALASRLSYFLWGTLPDAALMSAAARGELASPEQLDVQARRMIADPKAMSVALDFHTQWLRMVDLTDLPRTDPDFSPAARVAARNETQAFLQEVLFKGDGRLETLLTAGVSYVNAALGKLYGVAVSGEALVKTTLPNRAGLLTQISVLASHATASEGDPIRRGKLVRERLLCQIIGRPPEGIPDLPAPSSGTTVRERHLEHSQNATCRGCHVLMDPIGFGLGNFDSVGKFRTTEANQPIDVSGTIDNMDGKAHTFNGPLELAALLASSNEVRRCVATQWFRFAQGRAEDVSDASGLRHANAIFAQSQFNVRELMAAIASGPSFRYRASPGSTP